MVWLRQVSGADCNCADRIARHRLQRRASFERRQQPISHDPSPLSDRLLERGWFHAMTKAVAPLPRCNVKDADIECQAPLRLNFPWLEVVRLLPRSYATIHLP